MTIFKTRRQTLGLLGAGLCALGAHPARAARRSVRVGLNSVLSDIGVFMALEGGYFESAGLDIEVVTFNAAPQIIAPLSTNQIQVSGLSSSPAFFNAVNRGIGIRFVADKGRVKRGFSWSAIIVRTNLASQIVDFADLKGRRIAAPAKATNYVQLVQALKLGGLTLDDVEVVFLTFPDMVSALTNGAVDVAIVAEPFIAIATQRKVAVRWKGVDEFMPFDAQSGMIAYSEEFMARDPDNAVRWMGAYLRGVRDYLRYMDEGGDRSRVFDVIQRHTEIKNRALFDATRPIGLDRQGAIERASVEYDSSWYYKLGLQEKASNVDTSINSVFAETAAKDLG
jgi:NitT/TauT family transport system substrate-binding protein